MTLLPDTGAAVAAAADAVGGSDSSVIERSWGTPDVFAGIFDRHADDIHRYIARRLGADTADDLMAETFVIAFQRRRRYDLTHTHARPWLYGIATNLIGRHRRDEARRLRAQSRMASLAPHPEHGGPEDPVTDRLDAAATHAALAGALAALPARQRDVLLVIAWGELDYAEAAEALGVPVGTVRSRLHRARARLRRALDGTASATSTGTGPATLTGTGPATSTGTASATSTGTGPATSTGTGPATSTGTGPATSTGTGPATSTGTGPATSTGTGPATLTGTGPATSTGTGPTTSTATPSATSTATAPATSTAPQKETDRG